MPDQRVTNIERAGTPARFGTRVAARLIDGILCGVVCGVAIFGAFAVARAFGRVGFAGLLLFVLLGAYVLPFMIALIYRVTGEGSPEGQTPGKAALGIRLVRTEGGQPAGYGRALGRYLVAGIGDALFFLGSLSMLWNPQRRTWADRASVTAVVYTSPTDRTRLGGVLGSTATLAVIGAVGIGAIMGFGAVKNTSSGSTIFVPSNPQTGGFAASSPAPQASNPPTASESSIGTSSAEPSSASAGPVSVEDQSVAAAPETAQQEADAVDHLLDSSKADRPTLAAAISSVMHCTDVAGAVQQIQSVLNDRQQQLSEVAGLDVSALPSGSTIQVLLKNAINASLASDQHYFAWAQFVDGQSCTGNAPSNADLKAAAQTDPLASATKNSFVVAWNPVASQYGLRTRADTDL